MGAESHNNKEIEEILNEAHREFRKGLSRRSSYKVSNQSTVEDLVQDTFIKTWVYLTKGGKIDTMKSFLYHVLNNLIVDEYRKHKASSLDALLEKGMELKDSTQERTFNLLDGQMAMKLIEKLPGKYKQIISMRYQEDLSLEEISMKTGQSKNTIAVQLHRGLEKLKILYHEAEKRTAQNSLNYRRPELLQ